MLATPFAKPQGVPPRTPTASAWLAGIALLAVAGCSGDADPALPLANVRTWSLPAEGSGLPAPRGMTVGPGDELLVLDTIGRVLVYSDEGELIRQWNMPDASVGRPEGACYLQDGRIAVADTHYQQVVFFDGEGRVLSTMGQYGRGPGQFIYPVDVVQDAAGNLYVGEYGGNDRIQKFTVEGKYLLEIGGPGTGDGQFDRPTGVVWHDRKIYVSDAANNRVQVFTDDGQFLEVHRSAEGQAAIHYPYGISLGPDNSLWLIEYGGCRVTKMSLDGKILGRYGTAGYGPGQFANPWGIAVNSKGHVFVGDTGNRRVVELRDE
jgi:iron(III) transport system ATP-binding protein